MPDNCRSIQACEVLNRELQQNYPKDTKKKQLNI